MGEFVMKVFLLTKEGPRRKCRVPYAGATFALAEGKCPACAWEEPGPALKGFKVAGGDAHASDDDRAWECTAVCLACKAAVGTLRAEPSTLFGVTEDAAVLSGRVRVY